MNEELFKKCTEKFLEMGESFEYVLEHIDTVDASKLENIKDSVEFLQNTINEL